MVTNPWPEYTPWGTVYVVREPDDVGEPIVAICETEREAIAVAAAYVKEFRASEPRVEPYEFDRPEE